MYKGLEDTRALVATKVTNPPNQYDEVGRTARDPTTQRGATEGSRPGQQPRVKQRQAAGPPTAKRQEEHPPAQDSYYGPRAARAETTAIGCEGCGRRGIRHPCAKISGVLTGIASTPLCCTRIQLSAKRSALDQWSTEIFASGRCAMASSRRGLDRRGGTKVLEGEHLGPLHSSTGCSHRLQTRPEQR